MGSLQKDPYTNCRSLVQRTHHVRFPQFLLFRQPDLIAIHNIQVLGQRRHNFFSKVHHAMAP